MLRTQSTLQASVHSFPERHSDSHSTVVGAVLSLLLDGV